jgi:hypothetical protein
MADAPPRRRPAIIWGALYLMLMAMIQTPLPAAENNCIDHYFDGCFLSINSCVECSTYCANKGCALESAECEDGSGYCTETPGTPVYQECACQEA